MATTKQLKYYWAVIVVFALTEIGVPLELFKEAGQTLHENLKQVYGIESLSKLDTKETEEYFAELRVDLETQYGKVVPLPNDPPAEMLANMTMEEFLKYRNKP